jgi:hypothetical protein
VQPGGVVFLNDEAAHLRGGDRGLSARLGGFGEIALGSVGFEFFQRHNISDPYYAQLAAGTKTRYIR